MSEFQILRLVPVESNSGLCLHLYIYRIFYCGLWPGHFISREMVVNSVENIYIFFVNIREFSGRRIVSFSINYDDEIFLYLPTQCLVNTKYISLPSLWASLHLNRASGDSWHLTNQKPVMRSRDMCGPIRGPGLRGQVTRSSSELEPEQPVPSIILPSASQARGNIRQNMRYYHLK